jgi:hypothetical protein
MPSPGPPVDADGGLGAAGRGTGAGGSDGSAGGPAGASAASAGDPAGASPAGAEGCSRARGVGGSGSPNSGAGCSGAGCSVAGCSLAGWGPGFGLAISFLADRSRRTGSRATGSGGGGSLLVGSGGAIAGGVELSMLGTGISVFAESSARARATCGALWRGAGRSGIGHAGPSGSSPSGIGGSPKAGPRVGTSRAVDGCRSGSTGCGGGVETLFGAEGTALFAAVLALGGDEPGGREAVTAWRRGAGGAFARLVSVMAAVSRRAAAPLSPAVPRGSGLAAGGTIGRRPGSGRGPTTGGAAAAGAERSAAAGVAPAAEPGSVDSQAAGPDMVRSTQAPSGWPLAAPDSGVAIRSRSIATTA